MISAIGSSSFNSVAGTGPSIAALQARLDAYQKQLSDCVNCATATTPQGKQTIQDISSKISDVQARIAQASAAKSNAQPTEVDTTSLANPVQYQGVQASTVRGSASTTTFFSSPTLGNLLDVMA